MTKRVIFGALLTIALGGTAIATGWSQSHLTAENTVVKVSTGQVAGASTKSIQTQSPASPSIPPANIIPSPANRDATTGQGMAIPTPAATAAPVSTPAPISAPSPIVSPTPNPVALPVTTPDPIRTPTPPSCGQCGPIIQANGISSNIVCPEYCIY